MPRKHSSTFTTLCNPSIFRTLAYSEPEAYAELWQIQNRSIVRSLGYSKSKANSETCQASMMERCAKFVNSYSCFCKLQLFLEYQLFTFSTFKNSIKVNFRLQKCSFYGKNIVAQSVGGHEFRYTHIMLYFFIIV